MSETAFTPVLRRLLAVRGVEAALLVDEEGETVDYACTGVIFDAKVAGAHLHVVAHQLLDNASFGGTAVVVHLVSDQREFLLRRVSDDYLAIVLAKPPLPLGALSRLLEEAVVEIRHEGGIATPRWEPHRVPVRVELRASVGWGYAPVAFVEAGRAHPLEEVLGRWIDHEDGDAVCFLARTQEGEEVVLIHRSREARWLRRTDDTPRRHP